MAEFKTPPHIENMVFSNRFGVGVDDEDAKGVMVRAIGRKTT